MIFRNIIILICFISVISCEQYTPNNSSKLNLKHEKNFIIEGKYDTLPMWHKLYDEEYECLTSSKGGGFFL